MTNRFMRHACGVPEWNPPRLPPGRSKRSARFTPEADRLGLPFYIKL